MAPRPILSYVAIATILVAACGGGEKSVDSDALDGLVATEDDHGGTVRTTYRDGVKHGEFLWLRENGEIYQVGEYVDGNKEGVWIYDDIVVRFETHYEIGIKCGEERRWSSEGDLAVLRETRFYLYDDVTARGDWECAEDGECSRWNGIWYELAGDDVVRRTYSEGVSTAQMPVTEPLSCHSNLFP